MNSQSQVNNKRIAKNTIALYIRMIVIMAINFYMARVVLDVLGVTDYGIYNLVGTVVVVFSFMKSSLSEATQRFLNYEMGNGTHKNLPQVFSTCLNCYFILILFVLVMGAVFWLICGKYLDIPAERYEAASFVFFISLLSFSFSILHVPYNAAIVACEKMSFFAKISILEALLKLLLTVVVSYIAFDKLKSYSVLMCVNVLIILFVYYVYCHSNIPFCKYVRSVNKNNFKRILSFTGWNMVGSLAGVLSESGVGLLFNTFCGVVLNAAIGLSNQINGALSGFVSGYQTAFKPQLVKSYAAREMEGFYELLCRSSKFSYFLFFLISMPIIFNMDYLLSLWLVDVPPYAAFFSKIVLIGTLIDATSGVFYSSIGATGQIKHYQLSISLVFFLHFILTLFLLLVGLPYEWVFFSRLITRGLANFCLGIYFIRKLTSLRPKNYLRQALSPILKISILPISVLLFFNYSFQSNIFTVILGSIIFEIISVSCILTMGLSVSERKKIINYSKSKIGIL